jgi:plastocyanin domain-containing protein
MTILQLSVTFLGLGLICFIYWFFFGKNDDAIKTSVNGEIIVRGGYKPSIIKVQANQETKLTFLRKDENSCLEEIVIPDFKIKEYLPMNTPVSIRITPTHKGEFDFHCGMNMYHGKIIVV